MLPLPQLLLLENVRFYKEEEKNEAEFAKKVRECDLGEGLYPCMHACICTRHVSSKHVKGQGEGGEGARVRADGAGAGTAVCRHMHSMSWRIYTIAPHMWCCGCCGLHAAKRDAAVTLVLQSSNKTP
jgi:hypothetical protein